MGILQVNQIESRVLDTYGALIDTSDSKTPDEAIRTRGLAAWSLEQVAGASAQDAADAVTDGFEDNGIDAVWIDQDSKTIYIVQTKWSKRGDKSPALGDVHKFIAGFRDLVNTEFDRFNEKFKAKQPELDTALLDPDIKFHLLLAFTGSSELSEHARRAVQDLLEEVNDPIETATFQSLSQAGLHDLLRKGVQAVNPNLSVTLHDWGHTQEPYAAFYGQVDAVDVAAWFDSFGHGLFAKNIREFLGKSSEVNESLMRTLRETPEQFWYLNNGITVLCEKVSKAPKGGHTKKSGLFEFSGASVVNGAQTVGCIGEAGRDSPESVADARVMIRFISLENCPEGFANEVTRGTNTQNRVERRDFVALDEVQGRLRDEMLIEGLTYAIKSGESIPDPERGCTVVDATVALACAHPTTELAVQAKREIGRLWVGAEGDDPHTQYRKLFTKTLPGPRLWRTVRTLRVIDEALNDERSKRQGRERQIGVHGNRLIAHQVFRRLGSDGLSGSEDQFAEHLRQAKDVTEKCYEATVQVVEADFSGNYLASLFKNATRCATIVKKSKDVYDA